MDKFTFWFIFAITSFLQRLLSNEKADKIKEKYMIGNREEERRQTGLEGMLPFYLFSLP